MKRWSRGRKALPLLPNTQPSTAAHFTVVCKLSIWRPFKQVQHLSPTVTEFHNFKHNHRSALSDFILSITWGRIKCCSCHFKQFLVLLFHFLLQITKFIIKTEKRETEIYLLIWQFSMQGFHGDWGTLTLSFMFFFFCFIAFIFDGFQEPVWSQMSNSNSTQLVLSSFYTEAPGIS